MPGVFINNSPLKKAMKYIFITLAILLSLVSSAQKKRYYSVALFTTQNAMPYGKFTGLFKEIIHPGVEAALGKDLAIKKRHDWFTEIRFAYFFHRYVQHGFPLYLNLGYRYKFNKRLRAEALVGAGYMHSIPATAKLRLDESGNYENNRGVGRMQATAAFTTGVCYELPGKEKTSTLFASYQQRVQLPFVRSYVPLLPYSSFLLGMRVTINKKLKNK